MNIKIEIKNEILLKKIVQNVARAPPVRGLPLPLEIEVCLD